MSQSFAYKPNSCGSFKVCPPKNLGKQFFNIILDSIEEIPIPYKADAVYYVRDGDYVAIWTVNEIGELVKSSKLTNIFTLENIAELKTIRGFEGCHAFLRGYYADGDGGGGEFYWDQDSTETDNGGTIIQATGISNGRWKRVFNEEINIKWFGIFGQNISNDTTSLIKCLSYIGGSEGNGYNTKPIKLNLSGVNITFNEDINLPINVNITNGTLTSATSQLNLLNPYILNTGLRGYTDYWQFMNFVSLNVKYKCLFVISAYIKGYFENCNFNTGLVFVNSNLLWTEYNTFVNCSFSTENSTEFAIIFDGNLSGTSTNSLGVGVGADSFGYNSFRECVLDSTAPKVGIKIIDGGLLYNTNLDLKGYARGNEGALIYIYKGSINQSNFNINIESFGATSNIIKIGSDGNFWYNQGFINSASPQCKFLVDSGADIRSNNISVLGVKLNHKSGSEVFLGENYKSTITNNLTKREYATYIKPIFSVYRNANININHNETVIVPFDTEEFDTNSNFSSNKFTATIEGYYQFSSCVHFTLTPSVLAIRIMIYKNNSEVKRVTGSINDTCLSISSLLNLAINDEVTIRVFIFDTGGSPTIIGGSNNSYFNAVLLRD